MGRHNHMDIQRNYNQDTMIHIFSKSISSVSHNCCCISFTCHPAILNFPAQKCVCCQSKNINLGKKDLLKDMDFELCLLKQANVFGLYFCFNGHNVIMINICCLLPKYMFLSRSFNVFCSFCVDM